MSFFWGFFFHFLVYHKLNFKPFDKSFPFQKAITNLPLSIFLHYTRKFLAFDKCFLSQHATANFFLMLLLFSPCVWKVISVDRLIK